MKRKVCSFDFDDTLFEDPSYKIGNLWIPAGIEAEPIERIHKFLRQKVEEGYEVHVVSAREEHNKQEMINLCKLYDLPVKSYTCTAGGNKTPILKALRSEMHIDDNVQVLVLAQMAGIKCLLVDWNQHDTNKTADLFEKI